MYICCPSQITPTHSQSFLTAWPQSEYTQVKMWNKVKMSKYGPISHFSLPGVMWFVSVYKVSGVNGGAGVFNLVLSLSLSHTGHWKFNMGTSRQELSEDLKKELLLLGVTPNSRRLEASIRGAWFNSQLNIHGLLWSLPFWLFGGAQILISQRTVPVFSQ